MFKQKKMWFVFVVALLLAVGCAAQDDGTVDESAGNDEANETEQASTEIPEVMPTSELDPDNPRKFSTKRTLFYLIMSGTNCLVKVVTQMVVYQSVRP